MSGAPVLRTARLEIVPATPAMVQAALDGPEALAAALGATVPETWPHEFLDRPALEYTLARLAEGPAQDGWWMHFIVRAAGRLLIGSGGFRGPVAADGTVEVGYGIVGDQRRQGYASEALRALVARAFAVPEVRRVIAETLPELAGSIGVLRTCGFSLVGEGSEPGVIRFALGRGTFDAGRSGKQRGDR